ncbi:hypothetical protein [Acidovorax radicis]|uniref:hypothetical protein n=1 Tax=Acidovorax radicis TaxID=758826 RepID=UPI001CF9B4ED|nr:hypothetical protein [Acidovorax radicis]UCV00262.1 hypothetical protein KI609_05610 [Acidovorax radicis]
MTPDLRAVQKASTEAQARVKRENAASDMLDMAYINSLPQPFVAIGRDGWGWPVESIDVETGLVRVDVCGLLQAMHVSDFASFRDDAGIGHTAEGFYSDAIPEEREPIQEKTP